MTDNAPNRQIDAKLSCELNGRPLEITAEDRSIVVHFPDRHTCVAATRVFGRRRGNRETVHRLKQLLDTMRSTLEIRVNGQAWATLGYDVGSPIWQLFGFPPLKLRPLVVAREMIAQRR